MDDMPSLVVVEFDSQLISMHTMHVVFKMSLVEHLIENTASKCFVVIYT